MVYQDCQNVPNWFITTFSSSLLLHSPQTIVWCYFTVIATVNWTVQLYEQELKLSAHMTQVIDGSPCYTRQAVPERQV
jgi:hypothetical protein